MARLEAELVRLRDALHQAEARAEQAERFAAMGRLVAGLLHELNNPLTAVTMFADALAAQPQGAEAEKAAAILEATERIRRLTRDLVGFVRPSSSTASPIELFEVAEDALRLCRPELKSSGAVVESRAGAGQVVGSRESLVQVAVALISNAAQATRPGDHIRVTVAREGGQARLTVADDGVGMTPETLARAFEPFFTTRPVSGLGLGLSTARAIVERHGGRITLESAPGRGATATVVLPEGSSLPAGPSAATGG